MDKHNVKKEIQNYVTQLLLDEGYKRFTLEKIVSAMNISKKTIYKNFLNKEDVIASSYNEILNDAYLRLIKLIQSNNRMVDKLEELADLIKTYLFVFDTDSFIYLKKEFPSIWFKILSVRRRKFMPLLNLLIDHSKKHRLIVDVPNEILIKYFGVSLGLLSDKRSLSKLFIPYNKAFNDLFGILINGILTKKGKKLLAINKRMKDENE